MANPSAEDLDWMCLVYCDRLVGYNILGSNEAMESCLLLFFFFKCCHAVCHHGD